MSKLYQVVFLVTIFCNVQLSVSQDINTFFNKMMQDFTPKDTRYYTILNGVPVKVSKDGPIDNNEIYKRISSVLPAGTGSAFQQIIENDNMPNIPHFENNQNQWTPVSTPVPPIPDISGTGTAAPSKSWFSGWFGRSMGDQTAKNFEESEIITIDDIPKLSSSSNRKSFEESKPFDIKVGSSMTF